MKSVKEIESRFETTIRDTEEVFVSAPWHNVRFYSLWLAQTYYYVCHSTRLLASAAARFGVERDQLHVRFMQHMKEERQHEKLALKDIKNLGLSIENLIETSEISAFYKSQYFWIEHVDPISFFGYILCLEGLAVRKGGSVYKMVSEYHGERCANFLRVHAEEDPDHLEKAFMSLQNISPEHRDYVLRNLKESSDLYLAMMIKVIELSKSKRLRSIA